MEYSVRYTYLGVVFEEVGSFDMCKFFVEMMEADDDKRYQLIDTNPNEIVVYNEDLEEKFLQSLNIPANHTIDSWNEKQIEKQTYFDQYVQELINDEMPF